MRGGEVMIEAQRQLGSVLLQDAAETDFINYILEGVSKERRGKKQHIIILNINTEENSLEIEMKRIGEQTAEKYCWIGTADGAASLQWYFTSNKPDYLLSQTLPTFINLLSEDSNLYNEIKNAFDSSYYDLGPQKGMKKRYRYVLNLEKLGIPDFKMEKVVAANNGDVKKVLRAAVKALIEYVKEKTGLGTPEISLWNLKINNIVVVKEKEYIKAVIEEKIDKLYAGKKGICSLCNQEKEVTDNTTRFEFKYYMTDKLGFSAGLSGDFHKNMVLCKECYQQVLAGESFIKKRLGFNIGGFRVYLMPSFIFTPDARFVDRKLARLIKDSLVNINSLVSIENTFQLHSRHEQGSSYILNLLFYEKNQAEFKILKLIKDVPPSRFIFLVKQSDDIKRLFDKYVGESGLWAIDFNRIYYMLPIRVSSGSPVEYRKILDLYDNILSAKPVNRNFLIEKFVKMARIHHQGNYGPFNINNPNNPLALVNGIIQNMALLKYLESLNLVEGGKEMNVADLVIASEMQDYIKDMSFSEEQSSLFLLGYLIGEVARKQKAILNKINFQGMSDTKVKRLTSEILEKLNQYDVYKFNRPVYAEMKRLFDKNYNDWNLSVQDNVFYILSGYAYQVRKLYLLSKNKESEGEDLDEK